MILGVVRAHRACTPLTARGVLFFCRLEALTRPVYLTLELYLILGIPSVLSRIHLFWPIPRQESHSGEIPVTFLVTLRNHSFS